MTERFIYTIRDTVMKECNGLFLANNDEHAQMIFDNSVEQARKAGFKQEFKLYRLGIFNAESGEICVKCSHGFTVGDFVAGAVTEVVAGDVLDEKDPQEELF